VILSSSLIFLNFDEVIECTELRSWSFETLKSRDFKSSGDILPLFFSDSNFSIITAFYFSASDFAFNLISTNRCFSFYKANARSLSSSILLIIYLDLNWSARAILSRISCFSSLRISADSFCSFNSISTYLRFRSIDISLSFRIFISYAFL